MLHFLAIQEKEAQSEKAMEEGDYMAAAMAMWTTPFLPNLLNTCVWLVETAQCVAVLVVNYKGRPWMKGATASPKKCPSCRRFYPTSPAHLSPPLSA